MDAVYRFALRLSRGREAEAEDLVEMRQRVFEAILEEERQTGEAGAPAARMEPASGWRGMLRRLLGRGVDA